MRAVTAKVRLHEIPVAERVVHTSEEAKPARPVPGSVGELVTGGGGELRVVRDGETVLSYRVGTPLAGHQIHTEHELEVVTVVLTKGEVVGRVGIDGVVVIVARVIPDIVGFLADVGIEVPVDREGVGRHSSGLDNLTLFVDIDLTAVLHPGCRGVPVLSGLEIDHGIVPVGHLPVIGVVKLEVPVLGEIDGHTEIHVEVLVPQAVGVARHQLVRRFLQIVVPLHHSDREERTPAVEIKPRVSRGRTHSRIPLVTVRIDGAGAKSEILVDLAGESEGSVVPLEIIHLGRLCHAALVKIAKTDVERRIVLRAGHGEVVGHGRSPLAYHRPDAVIETVAVLVGSIVVPVATVKDRIVPGNRVAIFLLPLAGLLKAVLVDSPETSGRHRRLSVQLGVVGIFKSLDPADVDFLGRVLP